MTVTSPRLRSAYNYARTFATHPALFTAYSRTVRTIYVPANIDYVDNIIIVAAKSVWWWLGGEGEPSILISLRRVATVNYNGPVAQKRFSNTMIYRRLQIRNNNNSRKIYAPAGFRNSSLNFYIYDFSKLGVHVKHACQPSRIRPYIYTCRKAS